MLLGAYTSWLYPGDGEEIRDRYWSKDIICSSEEDVFINLVTIFDLEIYQESGILSWVSDLSIFVRQFNKTISYLSVECLYGNVKIWQQDIHMSTRTSRTY